MPWLLNTHHDDPAPRSAAMAALNPLTHLAIDSWHPVLKQTPLVMPLCVARFLHPHLHRLRERALTGSEYRT